MAENIENLLLEHLKRIHAGQERIERDLREVKTGLSGMNPGKRQSCSTLPTSRQE